MELTVDAAAGGRTRSGSVTNQRGDTLQVAEVRGHGGRRKTWADITLFAKSPAAAAGSLSQSRRSSNDSRGSRRSSTDTQSRRASSDSSRGKLCLPPSPGGIGVPPGIRCRLVVFQDRDDRHTKERLSSLGFFPEENILVPNNSRQVLHHITTLTFTSTQVQDCFSGIFSTDLDNLLVISLLHLLDTPPSRKQKLRGILSDLKINVHECSADGGGSGWSLDAILDLLRKLKMTREFIKLLKLSLDTKNITIIILLPYQLSSEGSFGDSVELLEDIDRNFIRHLTFKLPPQSIYFIFQKQQSKQDNLSAALNENLPLILSNHYP